MHFIAHRADIAKRLMQTLPVVEHFDVVKDRAAGLVTRPEGAMPCQFILQVSKEAFSDRIVIIVALAAHARDHAVLLQDRPVGVAGVDSALIGVLD